MHHIHLKKGDLVGARANVVLYNETKEGIKYSPVIYTHWGGSEMNSVVQSFIDLYHTDDSDTNMYPAMRLEVERCFPILVCELDKYNIEYQVFNFNDASKYTTELPKANDMPIIADDYGLYLINVETMTAHKSEFDWKRELA
jgi:hypothetical protein